MSELKAMPHPILVILLLVFDSLLPMFAYTVYYLIDKIALP